MTGASVFVGCALVAVCVALLDAAWNDLRRFIIPNRASIIIVAAYPAALLLFPPGLWFIGLTTGVIVLTVGAILFARGWVGGGDVKLAAASALWAGTQQFSAWIIVISISGTLLSAVIVLTPLQRLLASKQLTDTGFDYPMPFGVAIATGGLWVVSQLATLL